MQYIYYFLFIKFGFFRKITSFNLIKTRLDSIIIDSLSMAFYDLTQTNGVAMSFIELKNVVFYYNNDDESSNQRPAIDGVSFSVEKGEKSGRTYTKVATLSEEGRRAELARLTSGEHIGSAALDSAGELLRAAAEYKKAVDKA